MTPRRSGRKGAAVDELTQEQAEERKRAIFDAMSDRRRKHIQKMGYEKWNPFLEPKDPIDIRTDKTKRTTKALVREFLQSRASGDYGNKYAGGVLEICLGIVNGDDRYRAMFEFSCWYYELLKREGHLEGTEKER